jgi:hypothetical protein
MILNWRQFEAAHRELARFEAELARLLSPGSGDHNQKLRKTQIEALEGVIEGLKTELKSYRPEKETA